MRILCSWALVPLFTRSHGRTFGNFIALDLVWKQTKWDLFKQTSQDGRADAGMELGDGLALEKFYSYRTALRD